MCNPSKTEIIQFSFRFVKNPILSDFWIGDSSLRVQPSDRLRNLGVNLDIESSILQKGYASDSIHCQIEKVSEQGSPYKMMVNAFVTSRTLN